MRFSCDSHLSVDDPLQGVVWDTKYVREEGFFTEWKLGNTPKEKPRNPAFGGVFFWLFASAPRAVERMHDASVADE